MKNIAVLTSGGDSPGMNACVRAIVRYGISKGLKVYGIKRGYAGLLNDEFELMTARSVGNIIHTGGTILKTARCKEFNSEAGVSKGIENLKKHDIGGLIVIGGDGSFRGARDLVNKGFKVACIPGTIDNNLFYTDYTLGFDTAVNTVVSLINNVRETSISHDRVSIVETMGAGCGDLALNAGVASGADLIIVPEVKLDLDAICRKIRDAKKHGKQGSIIVLSEKIIEPSELCRILTEKCDIECRWTVFGHIQRGGSPTVFDRKLATNCGVICVDMLIEGKSGAAGYRNGKYIFVSIDEALKGKRKFDLNLYYLANQISF